MLKKRVLVFGGAGFIGSHFIEQALNEGAEIVNFDNLSYANSYIFLEKFKKKKPYYFLKADIRNKSDVRGILYSFEPDIIINFAAQSHVDTSLNSPSETIDININGTVNLLECVHEFIQTLASCNLIRFIQVSTDEVYGVRDRFNPAEECASITPTNIYASSKASADLICLSYFNTFNVPVIVTRCCNNYGLRQSKRNLIPKTIDCLLKSTNISLYGSGMQMRQWIHVMDHVSCLISVIARGIPGSVYHIEDNNFFTNTELVGDICLRFDQIVNNRKEDSTKLIKYIEDRVGHDFSYSISSEHTKKVIGNIKNKRDWGASIDDLIIQTTKLENANFDECK